MMIALLVAAGLLVRAYFIYRYPEIFGDDTIGRLAHTDRIVLGHQLPALQAGIHYVSALSPDPLLVRWYMAVLGAVAGVGLYLLMSNLVSPATAFDAGLLFVTSPLILADSVVPYQEILMLAGLGFAFHFALTRRWFPASLSLGLACLTRYEAWLACPVLAAVYVSDSGVTPRRRALLRATALLGWAPLVWMAFNGGIAPAGTRAIEWSTNPERLLRWLHLASTTIRSTPLLTLVLAGMGAVAVYRRRLFATRAYRMLAAFLALFLVAILFSAHGVGDRRERMVTGREAHVPIVAVIVLAALGLEAIPSNRFRHALTAASAGLGLWMTDRHIRDATNEPRLALSYQVARYLEREVPGDQQVAVVAPATDLEQYLTRVEQRGGPGAVQRTVRMLAVTGFAKPRDYQRLFVHSRRGRGRLMSYATLSLGRFGTSQQTQAELGPIAGLPHPQWVVLWSDFTPTNDIEAGLVRQAVARRPYQVFVQDGVSARLYQLGPPLP